MTSRSALATTTVAALVVSLLAATPASAAPPTSVLPGAPLPAAAPAGVIPDGAWVDDFDGTALDAAWHTVNPAGDAVTVADGALRLASQVGDTWQTSNTAKNLLMLDVPDADFTAVAAVDAPATLDFQGAGLIAWQDMDNYVRTGLSHIGFTTAEPHSFEDPIVVENGMETAGAFASTFTSRPGSTSEILRLQRTGDVLTSSYWRDGAWEQAAQVTLAFPVTQVGVYALASQDGTSHTASFDYVALAADDGADVAPEGTFTLRGEGDARYLTASEDGRLGLAAERPSGTLTLEARPLGDGALALWSGEHPVVVADGVLAFGAADADPVPLRLTDAGGGTLVLRTADGAAHVGLVDGVLTLGVQDDAVRLTVEQVTVRDGSKIEIDGDATSIETSDELYGIFYEDINYAADGGLYAELVRNRSFEFAPADNASFTGLTAWQVLARGAGAGSTGEVVSDDDRLNEMNRNYLRLEATGAGGGIRNAGYNAGVALTAGEKYDFTVWARTTTAQTLTVALEDAAGDRTFATGTVEVDGSDAWKQYAITLTATASTDAARLAVLAGAASAVRLDMVSLFPQDTWVGPVNGKSVLRKDLAEKIVDLEPRFLRFPGGCVTNVGTFDTYAESGYTDRQRTYQWKETVGPVEERPTNWNFWGYNQSYGIGYLEYFLLAEDLGAVPLPVVSVGANGCGSTIPELTDPEGIERWVQDTVDLVEFAIGDTSTEWGAVRAELGHPEPFDLRYIGLGNEENTTTFEANFPAFRDAIAAKFPQIEIISNSGPDDAGTRFDQLWDFNRAQDVDMVDEHYYNDPSWFLANTERYDSYDRSGPAVFLGEYASRGNTLWNALSEAAYMTGLERNSDVVRLASYAPLLSNEDYVQWSPDAIWFDNDESWVTPNYHVQQMFAANHGDEVVPSTYAGPVVTPDPLAGGVFLSTWSTSAAYDNLRVTDNATGDLLFSDDFADASQWASQAGSWAVTDGEYRQTSTSVTDARSIITDAYARDWESYTLELDARKLAGSEGFLVGFAAEGANDYFWWNLGGWNNSRTVLQKADGGSAGEVKAVEGHTIETDRTYRLKVVVEGRDIQLFIDGELQMEYTDAVPTLDTYQVVTRDTDTGELVVKVVNTSGETRRTQVTVSDVVVLPTGTVTELAGRPGDANSKAAPDTVEPVTREVDGLSADFTWDFAPYSVTFLRMQTADAVAPTVDAVEVGGEAVRGWRAGPVTVTATASDDRGLASLATRTDGGAWVASTNPDRVEVTVDGHGSHTVEVRATDAAGNVSATRPVTFLIDAKAPVTNAVLSDRTVALRGADDDAGMGHVEHRVSGTTAWTRYAGPVALGRDAVTLEFRGVDAVGNVEAVNALEVPAAGVVLRGSSTAAVVAPSSVVFGKTKASVRVRVSGRGGVPSGTVRVLDGSTLLATGTLRNGSVKITLPRRALEVGRHRLSVVYSGDAVFSGSQDAVALRVTKAPSKVKARVSPKKVTTRSKARVSVAVSSHGSKAGRVTVKFTSKVRGKTRTFVTKKAVVSGSGKASVRLPRLKRGRYTVRVSYAGSASAATATTTTRLTVRR